MRKLRDNGWPLLEFAVYARLAIYNGRANVEEKSTNFMYTPGRQHVGYQSTDNENFCRSQVLPLGCVGCQENKNKASRTYADHSDYQ